VLPLATGEIPAEELRAFAQLRSKQDLPPADQFVAMLLSRLDGRESAVASWCGRQGIPFLSMTPALRAAAAGGAQVYWTYDEHWSPEGHQVAAAAINGFCRPLIIAAPTPVANSMPLR